MRTEALLLKKQIDSYLKSFDKGDDDYRETAEQALQAFAEFHYPEFKQERVRQAALLKLTKEEIDALGLGEQNVEDI